jgi:hypothetical protein
MSQYQKSCNYCKQEIRMTNDSGKWLPANLDGSRHYCNNQETGTKKVIKEKELTLEERVERLERFILIRE